MNIGTVTNPTSSVGTAQRTLSGTYDTFLHLLITQLQNQDPLSPTDATKFTDQLVSYSQVEQQIATNTNLNSLISLNKAAAGANAVSYLGKTAMTAGNDTALTNGQATWQYSLPSDAANLQVKVVDAGGKVIRTLAADKSVGTHALVWDGKDTAGSTTPNGTYHLSIAATKSDGTPMNVTTSGLGMVSEIDMSGAEPIILIGTRKLKLADITGFKN